MCGSLATSMELKQQILHYYRVEEKSLREIARLTKTDRKTVSRLVHDFEAAIEKDPDSHTGSGRRKIC